MLINLSMSSSWEGTELIRHGDLSEAKQNVLTGLFTRWRFKRKFLQEACEDKEQFDTSQVLTRTHSLTYKEQTLFQFQALLPNVCFRGFNTAYNMH